MNSIYGMNTVNTSRILGLASGMDIEAMVQNMMLAKKVPLDKLEQQKQILEWQREDYRTLNTALYSFKDQAFKLNLEGTFNTKNAVSSNPEAVAATAGGNSIAGSYSITVNSLAAGVSKGSTGQLAEANRDGRFLTLFEQFAEFGERGYSAGDKITVNINGTELKFSLNTDNVHTMAAKINNAGLGVTASYDSTHNRFFLNTIATGREASLTISADEAGFLASGPHNSSILKLNIEQGATSYGVNASVDVGEALGLESATNALTINGITLNLKGLGSSTLNVSSDIESTFTAISDFVKAYNETIDALYGKVKEELFRDYKPLTAAQREQMKDDEITKWEKKAHSGLLRNDRLLQTIINGLRSDLSRVVEVGGSYNRLSQIGITASSYTENGKLTLDEYALRKALTDDPEGVKALFTNTGATASEKGIADKLYSTITDSVKSLADKAGSASGFSTVDNSYLGQRLTEMGKAIESWQRRLEDIESKYYRDFTAMETALNNMNIQSAWLASQFNYNA